MVRHNSSPVEENTGLTHITDMEVDSAEPAKISTAGSGRSQRKKPDSRRSAIVFPKYKAGKKVGLKVRKARRS